jgi:Domain of unknown function (DUF1854)
MSTLNGEVSHPFRLHYDGWGRLVLTTADGCEVVGIEPVRAFPITDPRRGISLCDAEGREVLWLDDLDAVPLPVRTILESELARRHFLPILERIVGIHGATEPTTWDVITDRGSTTFTLKSEEDVRRVAGQRLIVTDAFGSRYLVSDLRTLDRSSRRLLERYV